MSSASSVSFVLIIWLGTKPSSSPRRVVDGDTFNLRWIAMKWFVIFQRHKQKTHTQSIQKSRHENRFKWKDQCWFGPNCHQSMSSVNRRFAKPETTQLRMTNTTKLGGVSSQQRKPRSKLMYIHIYIFRFWVVFCWPRAKWPSFLCVLCAGKPLRVVVGWIVITNEG